ncbi:hypothetical protein [Micromonospora sp. CPCC 206061]|uniref:hypothetical protein n=1 Tax=Micromonospora sp. CPCC 206061 TaxID=3122410 RepID=UPI002FEF4506
MTADMGWATRPDPTRLDGGRGMWICRNLTTEIVIDSGPGGCGATVTAAIPAPTC